MSGQYRHNNILRHFQGDSFYRASLGVVFVLALLFVTASCSTTKRIESGEQLYTGLQKIEFTHGEDAPNIDPYVKSYLTEIVSEKPNASLLSSAYRSHPFPIGLWVYNNMNITSTSSKFRKWLYRSLVREPKLVSTVNPEFRAKSAQQLLDNNGYFGSKVSYEVITDKKDTKKAKISYFIHTDRPYTISSVEYPKDEDFFSHNIDSLARKSNYLKEGSVYNVDSLQNLRTNISEYLRDKGYYYFRPELIEYQCDSTIEKGKIAVRMVLAKGITDAHRRKYTIRHITTTVNRIFGTGVPDTFSIGVRGTVIQMKPSRLRRSLLPSCITLKEGKVIRPKTISRTETYLSRIGMFRSISLEITPLDSIKEDQDWVDVDITLAFDAPLEAKLDVNAAYKTNAYLGPGVEASLSHNNLFGGGEKLTFSTNVNYEWQIGAKNGASDGSLNYYRFGAKVSLAFPRLFVPRFIRATRSELPWSKLSLSFELFNNGASQGNSLRYYKIEAGWSYEWASKKRTMHHEIHLPRFKFIKRLDENPKYDNLNSAVVPEISYDFKFEKYLDNHKQRKLFLSASIAEVGNILSGIYNIFGNHKEDKDFLGVLFYNYLKLHGSITYNRTIVGEHSLVGRLMCGAAFIFGKDYVFLPYGEDFTAGGPSSIRGFGLRSIGPGAASSDLFNQYYRSGAFQFIFNLEYRFPLYGILKGAVFIDGGNVWALKKSVLDEYDIRLEGRTFFKQIALSTGAGLRLDMNMLVLRFDVGYALHAPYDTGCSGYFNMPSFKKSIAFNFAIGYPF